MRPTALRLAALMAAGALVMHELRYRAAYGDAAEQMLEAHGHGYLSVVTTAVGLLLALALGQFVRSVARLDGRRPSRIARPLRLWPALTTALLVLYGGQELLEGWTMAGHPTGLEGVVGGGGWLVLLFAPALGGLVAVIVRGAEAVLARAARCRRHRRTSVLSLRVRAGRSWFAPSGRLLARFLVGRAPPPLST